MTLVKKDHPRRIDEVIDYFGEPSHRPSGDAWSGGAIARDPSEPSRREAA